MAWNKKAQSKHTVADLMKAGIAISFALLLVACGGDSGNSTEVADGDGREVATLFDMGRCTSEREGDTVYVAEKLTDYLCHNGTWVDLSQSPDVPISSSAENQEYSSAEDIQSSSSSDVLNDAEESSSSFNKEAYTDENLVVKNRSILGVAQKGPFKFGSPVYLRELSEDSLFLTGMVYEDEISSNKGDFVIPNVNLIYPYASVEVRGLYRNEMTGEYSENPISLYALTDLKTAVTDSKDDARNKVNVNLLTHLEYNRAIYLVRKGYSVYAAKKQADQEIMTAFELPTTIKYSEDLSVFEDSEDDNVDYANASLMMLNLLFLGEGDDAEIKASIDKFIADIEKDGEWNDDSTKARMADFATTVNGDEIRANVKAWNILNIPMFETQMEMFWNNVYGLGGCSDKRKDIVAPNTNKLSKHYNKYFICNSAKWVEATTFEKDTYEWVGGEDGEFKKGNVTDTLYVYDGSKWVAAERETTIGLCVKSNAGVVSEFEGTYYICRNGWEKFGFVDARDGQNYRVVKIGDQIWMAENLNYDYNKGTAKSYCYENSADSCAKYGRLYTWSAAIDSVALSASGKTCGYGIRCTLPTVVQGVCPDGWHLPSLAEWKILLGPMASSVSEDDVSRSWYYRDSGRMLKSVDGWEYGSEIAEGIDYYGFSALPAGGYNGFIGKFCSAGTEAGFWSVTQIVCDIPGNYCAYWVHLDFNGDGASLRVGELSFRLDASSVRCVQN